MSSASKIAEFIRSHDHFLVCSHVFPDGDNMGSVLALAEIFRTLGKSSATYIQGPIPFLYRWMPGFENIDNEIPIALSRLGNPGIKPTLVIVDSGDLSRPGDHFGKWLKIQDPLEIANIDHHVSNTYFGTLNWVAPDYSSVGEMLFELIDALGLDLTETIAQNLFVSIYTDTGKFSFSNTTARSLDYAARLVSAGAKPFLAFRNIYASRSLESFHLEALGLNTLDSFMDGKGCYFYVDQEMLRKTGTTFDDTEGFIDTVRTLRDFIIVIFFKEVGHNDIRVSVRARPPIDASVLNSLFGGGGHPRAAGCRIGKPLREAIDIFTASTEEAVASGEALEKNP